MRRYLLAPVFLLVLTGSALAALQFPTLTGRVVDEAGILSGDTQASLTRTLADYEASTTNQIVVVTVRSLQGTSIDDYGYQLGRFWGIGQKGIDNGVLLIVAPSERKVRIEVGYGLEGVLTDAKSSEIIRNIILPAFRAGNMEQGIVDATQAIISTISGKDLPTPVRSLSKDDLKAIFFSILFALLIIGKMVLLFDPRFYRNHPYWAMVLLMSGTSGSGSSSGGGFGGGFSGGGGGFGGGGASGGW